MRRSIIDIMYIYCAVTLYSNYPTVRNESQIYRLMTDML